MLDEQKVELAAQFLLARKEYQPRYNYFILRAIPLITENQQRAIDQDLEDDRKRDLRHFNGVFTDDSYNEYNSGLDEYDLDEIAEREIKIHSNRKRRRKRVKSPKGDPQVEEDLSPIIKTVKVTKQRVIPVPKIFIALAALLLIGTAVAAFSLGFGTPLAYLIHMGEYSSFKEYLNSVKTKKLQSLNGTDNFVEGTQLKSGNIPDSEQYDVGDTSELNPNGQNDNYLDHVEDTVLDGDVYDTEPAFTEEASVENENRNGDL